MIRGFQSISNSLTHSQIGNAALCEVLEAYIAPIERAAERLPEEMDLLLSQVNIQTLVHTDIHPSNVLALDGC